MIRMPARCVLLGLCLFVGYHSHAVRAEDFATGLARLKGTIEETIGEAEQLKSQHQFAAAKAKYQHAQDLLLGAVNDYTDQKVNWWNAAAVLGYGSKQTKLDTFIGWREKISAGLRDVDLARYGQQYGKIRDALESASEKAGSALVTGEWSAASDEVNRALTIYEEARKSPAIYGIKGNPSEEVWNEVISPVLVGTLKAQQVVASRTGIEAQLRSLKQLITAADQEAKDAADRKDWRTAIEKSELAQSYYASAAEIKAHAPDTAQANQAWANVMQPGGVELSRANLTRSFRTGVNEKIEPVLKKSRKMLADGEKLLASGSNQDVPRGLALIEQARALATSANGIIQDPQAHRSLLLSAVNLDETPEAIQAHLNSVLAGISTVETRTTIQSRRYGTGPAVSQTSTDTKVNEPGGVGFQGLEKPPGR
jgi:hypothetical protein